MARKQSAKSTRQKRTPSIRKAGAGVRATTRSAGGRRKTAGAKTPEGKARRKKPTNPPRPGKRSTSAKRAAAKRSSPRRSAASRSAAKRSAATRSAAKRSAGKRSAAKRTALNRSGVKKTTKTSAPRRRQAANAAPASTRKQHASKRAPARNSQVAKSRKTVPSAGGTGREETLAQTPETGRSVKGRTNPMATRRSTGTPAGAGSSRFAPGLDRDRKQLREIEETIQGPPSSLDLDRHASAARSGRRHMKDTIEERNETSPALTGGDVDADWEEAYAVGDEAPGGDNPTPDQDRVDDIGKALGVTYEDNEELKAADKIIERDRHRWELDPASSDDYKERE